MKHEHENDSYSTSFKLNYCTVHSQNKQLTYRFEMYEWKQWNLSIFFCSHWCTVPLFSPLASLVVLVVFLCNNIWIIEAQQQERREWICGRKKHTHTHTHILPHATSRSYIPSAIHVVNENWYIQTEWIRDGMTIESSRECAHGCVSKKSVL